MKKTVFKDLTFSEERKRAVKESIQQKQLYYWSEGTLISLFETIQYEAKNGFDISTHLFQKSDFTFQNNEGQLYTLLHLLENKGILTSKWIEEKKYYSLTAKGKKRLTAYKRGSSIQREYLKHLLEEASL